MKATKEEAMKAIQTFHRLMDGKFPNAASEHLLGFLLAAKAKLPSAVSYERDRIRKKS